MPRWLLWLCLAFTLVAGAGAGCVAHAYRADEVHVHGDDCGHYYWHGGWYAYAHPARCSICYPNEVAAGHVHGDGCGHVFWHGGWHEADHPAGCTLCAAPPASAVVISSTEEAPPPARSIVVVGHDHYAGCGHYFWHDCWYAYPHPASCAICIGPIFYSRPRIYGPRVSVGIGIGVGIGGHGRGHHHR